MMKAVLLLYFSSSSLLTNFPPVMFRNMFKVELLIGNNKKNIDNEFLNMNKFDFYRQNKANSATKFKKLPEFCGKIKFYCDFTFINKIFKPSKLRKPPSSISKPSQEKW